MRNISNGLSIRSLGDKHTPGLEQYLEGMKKRLESRGVPVPYKDGDTWDFAACFSQGSMPPTGKKSAGREAEGLKLLQKAAQSSSGVGPREMMEILRDKQSGICMCDDDGFRSNGSQVSLLRAPGASGGGGCGRPSVHWLTATPDPSRSLFKPYIFPQELSSSWAVEASSSTKSLGQNAPHGLWTSALQRMKKRRGDEGLVVEMRRIEEEQLTLAVASQDDGSATTTTVTLASFASLVKRELGLCCD